MKPPTNALFRSGAATVCFVATDVVITACGIIYTIQSLAHNHSAAEIAAGVALTATGAGLGALSIRHWQRKRHGHSMPTGG